MHIPVSFLILIAGIPMVLGNVFDCNLFRCQMLVKDAPRMMNKDIQDIIPDEANLRAICPLVRDVLKCLTEEFSACFGRDLKYLLHSDNHTIKAFAKMFLGTKDLLIDICDENSDFHTKYIESLDCFKALVSNFTRIAKCDEYSKNAVNDYISRLSGADKRRIERIAPNNCMKFTYGISCLTGYQAFYSGKREGTISQCDKRVLTTLLEMIKRTNIVKYHVCEDSLVEDKTYEFIQHVNLYDGKYDLMSVFEFIMSE